MIVVDASIALKWFHKEKDSDLAQQILHRQQENELEIIAPDLLFIEIANAIATKSRISMHGLVETLTRIQKLGLRLYRVEKETIFAAAREARYYKTSVYDMLYAQFAKEQGVDLVTADEKFIEKTKFPYLKLLSEYL